MLPKQLLKTIFPTLAILFILQVGYAQQSLNLPSHSTTYGSYVRGYWFKAPVDFTITGLRVAKEAGSGAQNIHVFKINDNTPVVYSTTSTNFTTLKYIKGATNGVIQSVNIEVKKDDIIGILGQAGTTNSYGSVSGHTAKIAGQTVTLTRLLYQGNISSSQAPNYSTEPASSNISRVEMYYETCNTAITAQPQPQTICENQQTQFSIQASGASGYQWQVDEGSGFLDVSNSTNYAGATTNTLTVKNTPFTFNTYEYRCIAKDGTCLDTSNAVTLNVNGLVKLEAMPARDTTCINATMDLEVKGTGSITNYTWQIYNNVTSKFEDVPSSPPYLHLGNKLQIAGVPDTLDGARYRVLVDGVCDNDLSTTIQIKVNAIPKVAVPPADVNTSHGKQVMFEVQATAAGARFQWQVAQSNAANYVNVNDGGIYSGSRTNRLRVNSVTRVQNEYRFRCIVNTNGSCVAPGDTSQFAVLYVEPIVGVENVSSEEYMVIYPNPTSGLELYIELKGMAAEGLSYQVIDKVGRLVSTGKFSSTGKTTIDVSNLSADMYMIKMIDTEGKQVATSKFTKM